MKVIHYAVCSPTNAFFFFFFKTNSRQLWASQPEKITGFRLLTRTLESKAIAPVGRIERGYAVAYLQCANASQCTSRIDPANTKWQHTRSYSDEYRYEFGVIIFDFNLAIHSAVAESFNI